MSEFLVETYVCDVRSHERLRVLGGNTPAAAPCCRHPRSTSREHLCADVCPATRVLPSALDRAAVQLTHRSPDIV